MSNHGFHIACAVLIGIATGVSLCKVDRSANPVDTPPPRVRFELPEPKLTNGFELYQKAVWPWGQQPLRESDPWWIERVNQAPFMYVVVHMPGQRIGLQLAVRDIGFGYVTRDGDYIAEAK